MVIDITIFGRAENPEKLYDGPTFDKPGPILEIQDRDAVKLVVTSFPSNDTIKVQIHKIAR